jgi:virginiamycin B lyase
VLEATQRALFIAFALIPASAAHGQITEFPVPTSGARPYTIVAGPDGNLWFTESNGNKIGRITPEGVITEYPVPTSDSAPYGITVGADGAIWFTERFADQIGRLDIATGAITEFAIPTPFAQPWEITLGADGNLWFTEEDVNQIGRITHSGVVTEFVPPDCCFPTGICAGPDGNVWFTIEIGDLIGRIRPSGQITTFPIDSVQVLAWDITPGPDDALWFSELAGRALGRISTTGVVVEHPVPGDFSGIAGVATGADGNLWFTENDTDHVRSMDALGYLMHEYDTGARPLSIALGPDGNLWFTEADANKIGRIEKADPDVAEVLVLDSAFSPAARTVMLGRNIRWTVLGPKTHSVVDGDAMGLLDSAPHGIVTSFAHLCTFSGTFSYEDGVGTVPDATFAVPVAVPESAPAGVPFDVTWALAFPPAGVVFDVQVREPGAVAYVDWRNGTSLLGDDYTASTAGLHRFRARLRSTVSGKTTLYSPPAEVRATARFRRR